LVLVVVLFWSERRFVHPTGGFGAERVLLKKFGIFFGPGAKASRPQRVGNHHSVGDFKLSLPFHLLRHGLLRTSSVKSATLTPPPAGLRSTLNFWGTDIRKRTCRFRRLSFPALFQSKRGASGTEIRVQNNVPKQ